MNIWRIEGLGKPKPKSRLGPSSRNIWTRDFYLLLTNKSSTSRSLLNQENLKVEEYIREFEQLQMTTGLDEEPELKITRFIKGLLPSIANKVDLQPYLSFDDVCHLAIKVEKQLEG